RGIPEHLGYEPGPVSVVDQKPIAIGFKFLVHAHQRFRSRLLHEGLGRSVERRAAKIVRSGVTNVELQGGVQRGQIDQVRLAELAWLMRRSGGKRFFTQPFELPNGLNLEGLTVFSQDRPSIEDAISGYGFGGAPILVALEYDLFIVVQAEI